MATNFPTTLDTYTAKVDGTDYPQAAHINNMQDAIAAIEAKLGINSSAVSSSIDYILKNTTSGHNHDGITSKKVLATDINVTGITASQIVRVNSGGTALESSGKSVPSGSIVGTTDTQTLTNKTLTSPTITNASSTGTDSGTETLTNKTLTSPVLNTGVSGSAIDTSTSLGTSDTKLASQKAVKSYVDAFLKSDSTGLQIRYGNYVGTCDASGNFSFSFSSEFPTQCLAFVAMNADTSSGNFIISVPITLGYPTKSVGAVNCKYADTGVNAAATTNVRIFYIAIGN